MKLEFLPDAWGPLRVWKNPVAGRPYVIGADPAEGLEDGDFSAGFVIDALTREHCATWHGHMDPYPWAEELFWLGTMFNQALLAVERNNHGGTVLKRLVHELEYPNLYRVKKKATRKTGRTGDNWDYGILTTGTSRGLSGGGMKPLVVDMLRHMVRMQTPVHDPRFFSEGLTWVLDDRGRAITNKGANDDVLMAAAIAYYAAHEAYGGGLQPRNVAPPSQAEKKRLQKSESWRRILARNAEVQAGDVRPEAIPSEYDY